MPGIVPAALHVHDLLVLTITLGGLDLLCLFYRTQTELREVKEPWLRSDGAGSLLPESRILDYYPLFKGSKKRPVSGAEQGVPTQLCIPLWCPQCAISETTWENCIKFFFYQLTLGHNQVFWRLYLPESSET